MFIHSRTKGFFLEEKEYGPDSRIFTIFTKSFGKIKIFGKAIRKIKSKLRAGTEIFSFSEIEFIQGKIHKTLTDVVLLNKFKNIKTDSNRFQIASKISKDINDLVQEGEKDSKIWQLLKETFQRLDNWDSEIIYHYFFWNLISILGYKPELYYCHICSQKLSKENIYLFSKEDGIICKSCFGKIDKTNKELYLNISINTIKILRIILKKEWGTLRYLKIKQEDKNNLNSLIN
jgi:DNA repair protein RecO (recombination protein O)